MSSQVNSTEGSKMQNAVVVRGACKQYGRGSQSHLVLDNLNMTVAVGSIYGLLGASGCGKTTLLSCIVGRRTFNSGVLRVLGSTPGSAGSGVPGPRVGYMPQEIALPGELTVDEVLWYFGWIFCMENDAITERAVFLTRLLELPPGDRLVKNLSGGQQRRVSFAAALVHNPELLILDEPTVGLDPLLRQSIWDHLVEITAAKKVTIIITTHYIDEARQAHRIGLMRQGRLLAEAPPDTLLTRHGCATLEDVFLLLSMQQETSREVRQMENDVNDTTSIDTYNIDGSKETLALGSTTELLQEPVKNKEPHTKALRSSMLRMKALIYKNLLLVLRNPGWVLFIVVFPVLQISLFFLAVGRDPKGLTVVVVNEELGNLTSCEKMEPWTAHMNDDYICELSHISCLFVQRIDNTLATKKYYRDLDSALQLVRDGSAIAVLYFSPTFSKDLETRQYVGRSASDEILNSSSVAVYMDMSDRIKGVHFQGELYSVYQEVAKDIAGRCEISYRHVTLPMHFNKPVHGSKDLTYAGFLAPGIMYSMIYFLATILTCTVLITEQIEGVWDRNLVSGVTMLEVLLCHLLCYSLWMALQLFEVLLMTFLVFDLNCDGDYATVSALAFLQGLSGICYGLVITVVCSDLTMANYVSMGSYFPYLNLSGVLWPKEAMPTVLRWFSMCLPGTLPTESARYVLERGWSFTHPAVLSGFLITIAWIFGQCAFCVGFMTMKRKLYLQ
ncbi:ABC transporter G family member 23-like [Schistocerca nitens]|uniref:ABC transporter G family member 23-like n=1 Tax=Schistocerca nitens TaxID=7011 RepID=UPI002118C0CB|nr:ABC transporter G family member 23-like [Schistocerca nitens]